MPSKRKTGAAGLVSDLIHQFEDPLTFYRELIQNSIDAGSNRIDVVLEHRPGRPGRAVIRVEDDGEGMDEHVIDNYLLVLFSSTKENDFTKIGKFGIGFLSVFAPKPELVRVYTSKSGQSWRLDFPSPKRYEKYRLSEPREGTLVELVKRMPPREYPAFVEASRKTIERWCRHSEARIFFRDKSSRAPAAALTVDLTLPGGHSVAHEEEGTAVVLGFSAEEKPFFGFYNKGLTLKEGRNAYFPGVSFKVKSRYLEHTLTRDNVLEDENYRKAMAIVRRLVEERMPGALRRELEQAAKDPAPGVWEARVPYLTRLLDGFFSSWAAVDWEIFPGLSGGVSLSALKAAVRTEGRLFFDAAPGRASKALEARGVPVLRDGPWLDLLERRLKVPRSQASSSLVCPQVAERIPVEASRFLDALKGLADELGPSYSDILAADFGELPPDVEPPFFVAQKDPGKPFILGERERASLFGGKRSALLNLAHPTFAALCSLFARRPGLALFLGLKLLCLHDGKVPPEDSKRYSELADDYELSLLKAALRLEAAGGPA